MKIYMIGGTDSHVKCGVKDYTLELQRYLEQENVDIVQINDKSDTATISDWQSIFAYHKLAVELKKINQEYYMLSILQKHMERVLV